MTLAAMLASHDEPALGALASVGLVRRGLRDLNAGKAEVTKRDDAVAIVVADGQEVAIDAAGPTAARCTCPATGLCRHIVLAVLALRQGTTPDATPTQTARQDLTELSEEDLRKFAGADWDKALAQARISTGASMSEDGANLSILLPDAELPVLFLAGLGLGGAAYKGPKTTKRRVVTAAALVLRRQANVQSLDDLAQDDPTAAALSDTFLVAVRTGIADIVAAVFGGGSQIAEDALFDLSISARAQAAPRLTALLRILVRYARLARSHHFSFRDDAFLAEAGFALALTHALQGAPNDPALTGVVRQRYKDMDHLSLVMLGAVQWQADSGARGTRFYAFGPDTGTWYTTGQARAAGMDPGFTPLAAYQAPLWGLGIARKTLGARITAMDLRISESGGIAWDHGQATPETPAPDVIQVMQDAGLLFQTWGEARRNLAARMPVGLARAGRALPVVLAPTHIHAPHFDEIAQHYRLQIVDQTHATLDLTLPADRAEDAQWLSQNCAQIAGLLCEARQVNLQFQIIPITVFLRSKGQSSVYNLTLDNLPGAAPKGLAGFGGRALNALKRGSRPSAPAASPRDPIEALCAQCFDALAESLRFGASPALSGLMGQVEALGLGTLATALTAYETAPTPANALRAAYVLAEVSRATNLTH